jgi:Tfp pilus assembly protein PilZ
MNTITIRPEESYRERRLGLDRRKQGPPSSEHINRRAGRDRRSSSNGRLPLVGGGLKPGGGSWKMFLNKFKGNTADKELNRRPTRPEDPVLEAGAYLDRSYERVGCEVPVLIEDTEIRKVTPAKMFNYSKGGVYVESEKAPRIGKGVIIHMVNYSVDAVAPEDMRRYYARVVWVNKLSGAVIFNRYGVGVKLCPSIEEFIRLFGI